MTKLIRRLLPFWSDWKIVHGEGWVASHIFLDLEEGRKCLGDLFILQSCASFQEDEPLASWVTWSIVDVKLIMLVFIQKWPPSFEHGQVRVIPCKQNILIIRSYKYRHKTTFVLNAKLWNFTLFGLLILQNLKRQHKFSFIKHEIHMKIRKYELNFNQEGNKWSNSFFFLFMTLKFHNFL